MRHQDGTGNLSESAGDFILGLSWECRRIAYLVAEAIDGLFGQIFHAGFDGRRSIWWSWMKLDGDSW